MHTRVLLLFCLAAGFTPSVAWAQWTAFIPKPFTNGADFDVFTSFERDNNRNPAQPVRWTDTFIREKLTLVSDGYSYHPRFVQYHFSVAGTARQEDYQSTVLTSSGWRQGSGAEYDAALYFLPEHPYNLKVFASRFEPLFREQSARQHNAIQTTRGASFRYRKKPYFFHATYVNDSIDSADISSDVTRVGVDGEYIRQFKNGNEVFVNGAFNPSWFSDSQGLDGNGMEFLFGNVVDLKRVRLNSSVSLNNLEQSGLFEERFKNDQFAWYELLTVYLPWNFRADSSYRYQDNRSTFPAVTTGERTLSDKGQDIQFDLVHKLYQSVDTTYSLLRNTRTSPGGESTSLSNSLSVNYTKAIPRGRIAAGVNGATDKTDNRGQVDVPIPGESFSGKLPAEPYRLVHQNVEQASISVFFTSCVAPFGTVLLDPAYYSLMPFQNTFEIQVNTLPPQYLCDPSTTYTFFVVYSYAGTFELQTESFGGNISVQLFDDLLTPYFGYVTVQSRVLSGTFPGSPIDSTSYTTGLILHYGPLRARGEYQELKWQVSPYRAWRAELLYVASLTRTISAYATASYVNRYYPHGTSQNSVAAFTEESESFAANIQKQVLAKNLFLSVGGSYSRAHGLVESNSYTANASLSWKIGKLDLSLGASAYEADAKGTSTISSRRDHEIVFLKLHRKLL